MKNKAYIADENEIIEPACQKAPFTLSAPVKMTPRNINDAEKGIEANGSSQSNGQWGDFSSFNDKVLRIKFIRKVYLILTTQLIFTFGVVSIFVLVEPVKKFAQSETGLYLYIASYVLFVTCLIVSMCNCGLKKVPFNYILLGSITLTMTYMMSMISAYHDTEIVFIAIGITLFLTLSITLFSMQTKYDFTQNCWFFLVVMSYTVLGFGIACIIFQSHIMQAVYGGLGALLMSVFLAFDTQSLMGNKRFKFNPEHYFDAALQLYLDICYIFLYILQMIGRAK